MYACGYMALCDISRSILSNVKHKELLGMMAAHKRNYLSTM
jgi:hypothetical protein